MAPQYDMVVIGTGWHGLSAAKTYIELHPEENIIILEAENSMGGTWSADRLYPGLKSNNLLDTYEHPDLPMSTDVYGVQPGSHIPGTVLHRYLTDFSKKYGIYTRTKFNTKVVSLEPTQQRKKVNGSEVVEKGWVIEAKTNDKDTSFETRKVIVATGLTSQPNLPTYKGADSFGAPLFHSKDFCRNGGTVDTAERVAVVGGAKSSFDVAYAYAEKGASVDIIIRQNGNGPVWISYPWVMGGSKRLEKLISVRFLTWFSPCPWGGTDGSGWIRSFLHGTRIGRFIVDKFWANLGGEVLEVNGYDKHPEVGKLKPWNSAFWTASGLSIWNYDQNFIDMIKDGKIRIHEADVDHLEKRTVHLTDGTVLDNLDVLCCATGWRKEPSIAFKNFGPEGLGLPLSDKERTDLAAEYDEEVLKMFPRLRNQPDLNYKPKADPYRMYKFIVPSTRIEDRNIAFAGLLSSASTATQANAQALWISTFLDGNLDRPPQNVQHEIMLHTQWGRWRYPCGYGASLPDTVFDALSYIDMLLQDCGLVTKRKGGLKEYTEPYSPRDFVGLVDEWKEGHGR